MPTHSASHRSKRRQRKKARVPSFHLGGAIAHSEMSGSVLAQHEAFSQAIADAGGPPPPPPPPPPSGLYAQIAAEFEALNIEFDAGDVIRAASELTGGGGGGGGGGISISDIGPVRAAIENSQLALANRAEDFNQEIQQLQFALTSANSQEQLAINQQLANVQSQLARLQELKLQVDL